MKKNNTIIQMIVFIAILVFLNLVSLNIFKRFDFTNNKIYTLTNSSKETVTNLENRLIVTAYFSKNLPGKFGNTSRYVKDILSEYEAYSHGNFIFKFVDPKDKEEMKNEAQKNGIRPVPLKAIENDKIEMREVYLGLSISYLDKLETIPVIQSTEGLEYQITSKIAKITAKNLPEIAFFGADEIQIPQNMNYQQQMTMQRQMKYTDFKKIVSENYKLSSTKLETPLSENISSLVITGVTDSLSTNQLKNIDEFLMKDGNLIFFQDRVQSMLQQQQAMSINSNLFDLLENYGINIKNNIVSDAECFPITIQEKQGLFSVNRKVEYPFILRVHNVNEENPIVKNINDLQMIFASEIIPPKENSKVKMTKLFESSNNSGETAGPRFDISLQQFQNKDLKKVLTSENKVLAGYFEGEFSSFFNSERKNTKSKIIFIPDTDFIKNDTGIRYPGNQNFILNAIDFVSGNANLTELRSRSVEYNPLKSDISNKFKKAIKWINVLLPTLILLLIGLIIMNKRKNKRKMLRYKYE